MARAKGNLSGNGLCASENATEIDLGIGISDFGFHDVIASIGGFYLPIRIAA
jgi:hypothetical protein